MSTKSLIQTRFKVFKNIVKSIVYIDYTIEWEWFKYTNLLFLLIFVVSKLLESTKADG